MYGAYHHITVMGKENLPCDHKYDITGGLCENNDKFAIDHMLPKIDIGDLLVIHDTGAHGFADRISHLYREGAVTIEELEQAKVDYAQAEVAYKEALIKAQQGAASPDISSNSHSLISSSLFGGDPLSKNILVPADHLYLYLDFGYFHFFSFGDN